MIGILLPFLTSKLGGYAVAGLVFVVMSTTVYIQQQRLKVAYAELAAAQVMLDSAEGTNQRQAETIEQLTANKAAWVAMVGQLSADLKTADAKTAKTVIKIRKEVERVAVPSDDVPSPALGAVLRGLRGD